MAGKKSKAVAWFVSNCNADSKREDYVTELEKHIQVQKGLGLHGTSYFTESRISLKVVFH